MTQLKSAAKIQAAGEAQYTDDMPEVKGTKYAAYITSTVARATLATLDTSNVSQADGVVGVVTAQDIPGKLQCVRTQIDSQPRLWQETTTYRRWEGTSFSSCLSVEPSSTTHSLWEWWLRTPYDRRSRLLNWPW